MEMRDEGSGDHYNLQQLRSLESKRDAGRDNNNIYQQGQKKRKYDGIKSWENLVEGPLQDIFKRLNMEDYFRAGIVCKRWNSLSSAIKQYYLESRPPLVVHASPFSRRICYLLDISSGTRRTLTLPSFVRRRFLGVSHGYLILENRSGKDVYLVNPLTKKEHRFNAIPRPRFYFYKNQSIVVFSKPHQDVFLVFLNIMYRTLKCGRFKVGSWNIYSFSRKPWLIIDIIFFKDKLLILTNDSHIGTLCLEFLDEVILLKLNGKPHDLGRGASFLASNEELFVVDFISGQKLDVYRIDFEREKWVKVDNLGDRAIFLCEFSCSLVEEPSKWGGFQNSLYHLHSPTISDIYSVNGQLLRNIYLQEERYGNQMNCWYSLHGSSDIDAVLNGL